MENKELDILIVDDQEDAIYLWKQILIKHKLHWTRVPEEALILVKDKKIDIVFTDFHMPGMNGIQLGAEIRKIKPELPVFLVTTDPSEELEQKAKKVGIRKVIRKPFSIKEIWLTLKECKRPAVNSVLRPIS